MTLSLSAVATLPIEAKKELFFWKQHLQPLIDSKSRGVTKCFADLAKKINRSEGDIRRKFYKVKKKGWLAIIDKRILGPEAWNTRGQVGLSFEDKELLKTYCENFQRNSAAAIRALRRDWRKGIVKTSAPLDTRTGYPQGWSERNLSLNAPTTFELKATRVGRSAASSERRLVYTTRADLWVGSHYLFDDMWHDHFVNHLDQRKAGRPLEFHALDLFSACKFAWGMRVRLENTETGVMEGLKGADMRFLLANIFGNFGYSDRGTELVVEEGTAAIDDYLEELLYNETGRLVTVARNGMQGAAAHAGQYAGRAKGNFRFKAALESLGNLIHNEMAYLPGQTGKDIDHRPEGLHGLLKHNDALLAAMSQLAPERAEMLQWPLLTIQQFRMIADEIYHRINDRRDHALEGWDLQYVPCQRTGGMRRRSPLEVFKQGRRGLQRLNPQAVAMILGIDSSEERTVRKGMIQFRDGEISGDVLSFEASRLGDGQKFATVLNPYQPDVLWLFDAKGRYVSACELIKDPSRADVEAVQRAMGEAAKVEGERLLPLRRRHLKEARAKEAMHRHNADVVGGAPITAEEIADSKQATRIDRSATRLGQAARRELVPKSAPAPDVVEDLT